jgi:hypothetical protein
MGSPFGWRIVDSGKDTVRGKVDGIFFLVNDAAAGPPFAERCPPSVDMPPTAVPPEGGRRPGDHGPGPKPVKEGSRRAIGGDRGRAGGPGVVEPPVDPRRQGPLSGVATLEKRRGNR